MTRAFADRPGVTVAAAPGRTVPPVDAADSGLRVGGDLGAVPVHTAGVARPQSATAATFDDLRRERADFLRRSADYYGDPGVPVDVALFNRVLDSWHRMIADDQGDDGLRSAYRDAVGVLMGRAAGVLKVPLDDLYRANRGRIPMWAWPEPHHLVGGIQTPVPAGQEPDPVTGAVRLTAGRVTVSILPDVEADDLRVDGRPRDAVTGLDYAYETPKYEWEARKGERIVTGFEPAAVTFTVRTRHRPAVRFSSSSKYGRGTTPEDLAGAQVDPYSATLGFHEGQHGMDLVEFLRSHEPPAYPGTIGMTVPRFEGLRDAWLAALKDYVTRARELSAARTDRVGVREGKH